MAPIAQETTNEQILELPEGVRLHHESRKKATRVNDALAAEYPGIRIAPIVEDNANKVDHWVAARFDEEPFLTTAKVPSLGDVLEAAQDAGIDPSEEATEEEEAPSGSIVGSEYRTQYRENSVNGQTCGDWLAEWLTTECHSGKSMDFSRFEATLEANGVDLSAPWARASITATRGWQGRYRMSGRKALEKKAAWFGYVRDAEGNQHDLPEDALAKLQQQHAKWLAKEKKREAAQQEVAEG